MTSQIGLAFDVLVLIALIAAIWRATLLSKQISDMQADKKAFEQLIQALNLAASRAEAAVRALKDTAGATGDALQEKTSRARGLAEELEIMVQAGDNLAERLNTLAEESRKARKAADGVATDTAPPKKAAGQPRSRAEKELADALKEKQSS